MPTPVKLSDDLVEFVESGVSMFVGTCDPELRPETLRGVGALVGPDRQQATVFVPEALAERTLANLAKHPNIAVVFSRPVDHRSVQLKGPVHEVRPAREDERPLVEHYLAGFVEQLYCIGLPRGIIRRLRHWPAVAIRFTTEATFHQTPGPGAGGRMGP